MGKFCYENIDFFIVKLKLPLISVWLHFMLFGAFCFARFTGRTCESIIVGAPITVNSTAGSCASGCSNIPCAPNYYSPPSCNTFCRALDSCKGHYTCNQTDGTKICMSGWSGTNCNISTSSSTSNCCESGGTWFDGSCFCPPG